MPLFHAVPVLTAVEVSLYLLPSLVAVLRRAPHLCTIFLVNTLLGWTVVGWLYSMACAAFSERNGQSLGDLRLIQLPSMGSAENPTDRNDLPRAA